MAEMMDLDEESRKQLDRWVEAKRSRDFATADRIRSLLEAKGIKPDQARPHVWEPPAVMEVKTLVGGTSVWP